MAELYPLPDVISPVGPRTAPARADSAAGRTAVSPPAQVAPQQPAPAPPAASGRGQRIDVSA